MQAEFKKKERKNAFPFIIGQKTIDFIIFYISWPYYESEQ